MKCSLHFFSIPSICFIDWFFTRWKYISYVTVIIFTFHGSIENHYIGPLNSCDMAKICNHTGISICGLENDHHGGRLFLDDCDMYEYNCDNSKAYLKVDDKFCPASVTEDVTTITETTINHTTSETTSKTSVNLTSTTTTVGSTDPNVTRIPIASDCTRSKKTDSPTIMTVTKDIKTTSAEFQRCTCMDTDKTTTTGIPTTMTPKYSESTDSTLTSTGKSCTCNSGTIPMTESIPTTLTITTTTKTTSAKINRCTCMDRDTTTTVEIPTTTTPTYSKSTDSTLPLTETTQTQSINTLTSTGKLCTCNSANSPITQSISTTSTITTTIKTTSAIINRCNCMDKITAVFTTTTSSPIMTTSTKSFKNPITQPGCTCTHPHFTSTVDTTTSTPTDYDESTETETTVDYTDVIPTPDSDSCKKYPKHCKRPQTWETTARGETRDFFQILREKFGNRIKILKDTTHFPRRTLKAMENYNEAFLFGDHNET